MAKAKERVNTAGGCFAAYLKETLGTLVKVQGHAPCDGVRALAVLWVCSYHALPIFVSQTPPLGTHILDLYWPVALPASGEVGVDIFLVLSGFLIGGSLFRETSEAGSGPKKISRMATWFLFYLRRFFRIAPAYAFAMLVTHLCNLYNGFPFVCPGLNWWQHFIFIENFAVQAKIEEQTLLICLPQSWSISLEFQFYLATPPLFALAARLSGCRPGWSLRWCVTLLCAVLWFIGGVLRLWFVFSTGYATSTNRHWWVEFYFSTQYRWTTYVAGIVAGVTVETMRKKNNAATFTEEAPLSRAAALRKWLCVTVSFCVLAAASIFGGDAFVLVQTGPRGWYEHHLYTLACLHAALSRPLLGASVAYLLALACTSRLRCLAAFLGAAIWRPVAGLSYSMYLLQLVGMYLFDLPFLAHYASKHTDSSAAFGALLASISFVLFVFGALPLAVLSYFMAERPGMLLGKRVGLALAGSLKRQASEPPPFEQMHPDSSDDSDDDGLEPETDDVDSDDMSPKAVVS